MTPERTPKAPAKGSRTRVPVRRRRRGPLAPVDPVAPVWWPEYVGMIAMRDKALRVVADYNRRIDLATWYAVEVKGVRPRWFAIRLGVSDQRIWNRVRVGREYVARTGMSEESVAELLFTPLEKLEARRRRRADRAQRLEERLADITLPDPPATAGRYPWLATPTLATGLDEHVLGERPAAP